MSNQSKSIFFSDNEKFLRINVQILKNIDEDGNDMAVCKIFLYVKYEMVNKTLTSLKFRVNDVELCKIEEKHSFIIYKSECNNDRCENVKFGICRDEYGNFRFTYLCHYSYFIINVIIFFKYLY